MAPEFAGHMHPDKNYPFRLPGVVRDIKHILEAESVAVDICLSLRKDYMVLVEHHFSFIVPRYQGTDIVVLLHGGIYIN